MRALIKRSGMSVRAGTEVYGEARGCGCSSWCSPLSPGHVLLQCEKLLLAECCLLPVFPYGLHWSSSVQIQRSHQTLQENRKRVNKGRCFLLVMGWIIGSASSASFKKYCFIFKKIEASFWKKKSQFHFGFNYIVFIFIMFKKSLNMVLQPFLQNEIRSLQRWEGLERNDDIH